MNRIHGQNRPSPIKTYGIMGVFIFVALMVLGALFGSFYTIDEGNRGVVVRMGVITGTAEPGFHVKMPFVTTVHEISIRDQMTTYEGLEAYTTDQQIATIEGISVGWRVKPTAVEQVYRQYKTEGNAAYQFVGRRVNAELEKVFGQFSAERTVQERTKLSADVSAALKAIPDNAPIEVFAVELSSIAYPAEYSAKINDRMAASVEVAKKTQEVLQAEQDKQKAQKEADARAYEVKAQADAAAHAIRVRGEAEAEAIRLRSEALANNPALIELTKAERWDGVLPTSMIPGSSVPFISVK